MNMKKYVSIIIAFVAIVVGTVIWFARENSKPEIVSQNATPDARNWLLYTNPQMGISFQYPQGVTISSLESGEVGVSLHFPNQAYTLMLVQPQGGMEGYSTKINGFEDKVVTPMRDPRIIRAYDSDTTNDVMYFASVAGDGTPQHTWIATSLIEKPVLTESLVMILDQIVSSFKVTK